MNTPHSATTQQPVFLVFYSNQCPHSKEFLHKLHEMDAQLYQAFKKICVDDNPSIPSSISTVPTIIVPTHSHPLTDSAVFMWLNSMADQYVGRTAPNMNVGPTMAQQTGHHAQSTRKPPGGIEHGGPISGQDSMQPSSSTPGQDNIQPFMIGDMSKSYSGGFSFLDNDEPILHNYSFLDGASSQINTGDDPASLPNQGLNSLEVPPTAGHVPAGSLPQMQSNHQEAPQFNVQAFQDASIQPSQSSIDRPSMTENGKSGFDSNYEQFMNSRDQDPYIQPAPQRR